MWNATLLRRVLPSPKDSTPYPFETARDSTPYPFKTARDSNREIWTRPLPLRPTQQQTRVNRIYQPVRLYQHSPRTETIYSSFNHSYISLFLTKPPSYRVGHSRKIGRPSRPLLVRSCYSRRDGSGTVEKLGLRCLSDEGKGSGSHPFLLPVAAPPHSDELVLQRSLHELRIRELPSWDCSKITLSLRIVQNVLEA